ncbi:MAG: dihydrolipoamide acetyltransferase family protein, partial [Anaerolineae bacterium]
MQIILPKLGLTTTHGTITEWLKAPGDAVKAEETLCTYETEKVTLELPSPADGVLAEILVPAGETVAVGTPLCVVETGVESQKSKVKSQVAATPKARALARQLGVDLGRVRGTGPGGRVQAMDIAAPAPGPSPEEGALRTRGAIKATPLARRMAAAEGIDLSRVIGTGPDGTITREDVEAVVREQASGIRPPSPAAATTRHAPPTTPSPGTVVPISTLRRVIGERMSQSAFSAPHVTLFTEAEATNLVSARRQLNEELASHAPDAAGDRIKISYNALFAALVARALKEHPYLNARLEPDGIHLIPTINIALAVDTERGLVTPVLHDVDRLSLAAIQAGYDALIGRALAGKSLPEDFEGGTFTITNLGALDVDGFTPIINPPQAAILGIGRIIEKPVAREGAVVVRPMVTLSLSFDHRIVDGAPAGRFLQRVKQLVER